MPAMPSLKPLIEAASKAYQDIRKPKEESYLYQGAALVGHYTWGTKDTSTAKKSALTELAELKTEDGSVDALNAQLLSRLGEIKHEDGDYFPAIYTILTTCGALVKNPMDFSPAAKYSALLPQLILLQSQLKPEHPFFTELRSFFEAAERFALETQHENYLEFQRQASELQSRLQSQIKEQSERHTAALAEAKMENEHQAREHQAQLQALSEKLAAAEAEAKAEKERQAGEHQAQLQVLSEKLAAAEAEAKAEKERQAGEHQAQLQALSEKLAATGAEAKQTQALTIEKHLAELKALSEAHKAALAKVEDEKAQLLENYLDRIEDLKRHHEEALLAAERAASEKMIRFQLRRRHDLQVNESLLASREGLQTRIKEQGQEQRQARRTIQALLRSEHTALEKVSYLLEARKGLIKDLTRARETITALQAENAELGTVKAGFESLLEAHMAPLRNELAAEKARLARFKEKSRVHAKDKGFGGTSLGLLSHKTRMTASAGTDQPQLQGDKSSRKRPGSFV